jgi:NAD(P)-dependent dehydrogenase (short-subunit alcohol dehydrogenase family)
MTISATPGDPFSLHGRVALVTGATRGIGAAIVRRFTAAGAKVALSHRGTERNERLAASLISELGSDRVMAVVADAASGPDMTAAIDQIGREFGAVDVLILNAAESEKLPWDEITVEDWDRIMETNLRGAFVGALAAVEGMREKGYGKVMTIGSVMATTGDPRALHYVTTKGGLIAFARALSRSEGENGIRVNCVVPGAIQVEREAEEGADPEKTLAWMRQVQALKYRGQPRDIAAACQYLASPAGDFVTGQVLTVDGGWTNY